MSEDNPLIGSCEICGFSVWQKQAYIKDTGDKVYHVDCRMIAALRIKYEAIVAQAEKALNLTGHKNHCQFAGCTCGATADFRIESGEFYRLLYDFKTRRL